MKHFRALLTVACLYALAASQLPSASSFLLGGIIGGILGGGAPKQPIVPRQPVIVPRQPVLPIVTNPNRGTPPAGGNCGGSLPTGGGPPATPPPPRAPAGIVDPSAPSIYHDLANTMWAILLQTDDEQVCNSPAQCPCPGQFGDRNGPLPAMCTNTLTGLRCGATSRLWWRAVSHDCCTFNAADKTGGCDGSLEFELKRPENADAKMEEALRAYKIARELTMLQPQNVGKKKPTMADMIILAGMLGLAKCGGPIITFTPGLEDADVANGENLLPDEKESIDVILSKMQRTGFSPVETVVLVGTGHTMARLHGRTLDATPDKFDNRFFVELSTRSGMKLKSDLAMLEKGELVQAINLFASNEAAFKTQAVTIIKKMISLKPAALTRTSRGCRQGTVCG